MTEITELPALRRIREQYGRVFMREDINLLETWLGLAFLLRGIWMLHYRDLTLPPSVHEYLVPASFSVLQWGWVLATVGVVQLCLGLLDSRRSLSRALTATMGAVVQTSGLNAYYRGHALWLGVVPMVIVIVIGEMFIAYRMWRGLFRTAPLPIDRRKAAT
jgi:hypothetical protein